VSNWKRVQGEEKEGKKEGKASKDGPDWQENVDTFEGIGLIK
jgi:hypothetical protein